MFPAAEQLEEMASLVDELRIEHGLLRRGVKRAEARDLTTSDIQVFAASLSAHIRKEERELFEAVQRGLSPEELERVGEQIEAFFQANVAAADARLSTRPR